MGAPDARTEYHLLLDVLHEAADRGDVKNTLRLSKLADNYFEAMPASEKQSTYMSYKEGVASLALLETVENPSN